MVSRRKLIIIAIAVTAILVLAALLVAAYPGDKYADATEISVSGLVDHELALTLDDLKSRTNLTITSELVCVSGQSLGTHSWTGILLRDLLNEARIQTGAVKVAFRSSDDYSTDLTMQDAMRDDVLVAFMKDGAPLNEKTKLVVPGKWGYKWISGIVSIQVVDFDFKGTWESRGYSDDASIRR